ncbi:glutathione binding-like protein [Oceaniovalibus sp. ACAM 378]|jgi:glutathione S-transferase
MAYLGEVLADNDFLAGSEFSVADITAFAGL